MDAPQIQYARTDDGVNIAYWTLGEGCRVGENRVNLAINSPIEGQPEDSHDDRGQVTSSSLP